MTASPRRQVTRLNLIAYWTTTAIIALETFTGGVIDLGQGRLDAVNGAGAVDIVTSLGFPSYVLTILGVWKLLGAATVVLPGLRRLKEWAYAGIVFELTGAAASQMIHGDHVIDIITALLLAAIAMTSWALRPPSRTLAAEGRQKSDHVHAARL